MKLADVQAEVMRQVQLSDKLSKLSTEELMCFGVTGLNEEAGEVAGLLCREVYKKQQLPHDKWYEELGDVLWYLAVAAHAAGCSLEQLWDYNVNKLQERYPECK